MGCTAAAASTAAARSSCASAAISACTANENRAACWKQASRHEMKRNHERASRILHTAQCMSRTPSSQYGVSHRARGCRQVHGPLLNCATGSHLQHSDRGAAQAVRVSSGGGGALGGKQAHQGVQPGGWGGRQRGIQLGKRQTVPSASAAWKVRRVRTRVCLACGDSQCGDKHRPGSTHHTLSSVPAPTHCTPTLPASLLRVPDPSLTCRPPTPAGRRGWRAAHRPRCAAAQTQRWPLPRLCSPGGRGYFLGAEQERRSEPERTFSRHSTVQHGTAR